MNNKFLFFVTDGCNVVKKRLTLSFIFSLSMIWYKIMRRFTLIINISLDLQLNMLIGIVITVMNI